ncbi:MAG: T9SS type A sorting domain-containing protein [Cyclobacteriaceae bacterium]
MKNLKHTISVLMLWLLGSGWLMAQNFEWAAKLGGTDADEGWSITTDASGNVYTAGTFKGTADFNPGAGINQLTSNGQTDFFISKVNASGVYQWAVQFGSTGIEGAKPTVKTDPSGNVYLAGSFRNTVDFNPGAGTNELIANGTSLDGFVVKLNGSGVFQWVKHVTGSSNIITQNLEVDASGNAYVAGNFTGTVNFRPEGAALEETAQASGDSFVMKVSSAGALNWVKIITTNSLVTSYGIALDASNNVYISGTHYGTVDFDPGANTASLTSTGGTDAFITKWNSDGEYIWAKNFGGTTNAIGQDDDVANAIAVDHNGNVVTTGFFRGSADFDPGAGVFEITSSGVMDIFVSKLDVNGNFIWATALPGPGNNIGYDITVDAVGNIYSTGQFGGQVDFDPGVDFHNLSASGAEFDIYVSKLKSDGSFAAAFKLGSTLRDRGYGISVDADYNIYTTGFFNGSFDFDPTAGLFNLSSAGLADAFVLKMSQVVNIPDANFKAALLAHTPVIDTNDDDEIQIGEAAALTGHLNVPNKGINDLTGVEYFANITQLTALGNNLTSVDVSALIALTNLGLSNNNITSLDISHNTSLKLLFLENNDLTSLDLSSNDELLNLQINGNQLTSLDLSNNSLLQQVSAYNNDITTVNLTGLTKVTNLNLTNNQLTSIDLSDMVKLDNLTLVGNELSSIDLTSNGTIRVLNVQSNNLTSLDLSPLTNINWLYAQNNDLASITMSSSTAMTILFLGGNQLTSIDLSANTGLTDVRLMDNALTSLDLSPNTLLEKLFINNNSLQSLNIKNGNNAAITTFDARGNFELTCITVDNVAFAEANFTDIDPQTSFSGLCNSVHIPDANFKAYLLASAINTVDDGEISFEEAEALTGGLIIRELSIADLTGIEAFVNMTSLDCFGNALITLDLSSNTALTNINCRSNLLNSLNVSGLTELNNLDFTDNLLTSIDVTSLTAVYYIGASSNQLTSIDVSNNLDLEDLGIYNSPLLTSLDLTANISLVYLEAYDNPLLNSVNVANGNNGIIETLDLRNNPNLTCITVDDVAYAEANFADIDPQTSFSTDCRADNEITFNPIANQFLELGTLTLSATSSSGLPVDFEVVSGPASLVGNQLTFTDLGNVTVKAVQPGDDDFKPAIPVEQSFEIILITSVPEQRGPQFKFYPNPVDRTLVVVPNGSNNQLSLQDVQGRVVTTRESKSSDVIQVDVSTLPVGMYILKLSNEAGISQTKILKK